MDLSSLIIGMLIGAVGVFATGFFRKAGEDLYSAFKGKVSPNSIKSSAPQVIVSFNGKEAGNTENLSPVTIDHTNNITFSEIRDAINSVPPLQRESIANNYIGLKVEWHTYLFSAGKDSNGNVSLDLSVDKDFRGRSVACTVKESDYKELSILNEGAEIRVTGVITKVGSMTIELSDVHLQILKNAKT